MMVSLIENLLSLIGALLLLSVVASAVAAKTKLIDEDGVESIAQTVCSRPMGSSNAQIGSVSTIQQMVAFFDNFPENHKLKACRDTHSDSLHLLYDIVSTRNDNVCSDEKISLIEKFHHRYISKTKRDKKQQKLDNAEQIPKLFKYFFYHYATQVAATCKNSLVEKMNEAAAAGEKSLETEGDVEKVDLFLADFSKQLGMTSGSLKTYGGISLLWSFIDRMPIQANNYISQEGKRVAFETKDPNNMRAFQRECSTRLKPVYGSLALPVIRLIDLGYYLDDEPFAAELAERADLRRLIGVAQVCEFMLPIRVVANDKLAEGEMLLLTKDRASEIPSGCEDHEDEVKPETPVLTEDDHHASMDNLNVLTSATSDGAQQFVKTIRFNIKARERTLSILFNKMADNLIDKTKSMLGKFFYLRKDSENRVKRSTSGGVHKYDLMRELKYLRMRAKEELKSDWGLIADASKHIGPFVVVTILFILLKWIDTVVFKSICLILYATVGLPIMSLMKFRKARH